MDMRQIIYTQIDETTKEEKKQKIIALLKAEKETMEKMADKKAYHTCNADMKQILNEIIKGVTDQGTKRKIQTLM